MPIETQTFCFRCQQKHLGRNALFHLGFHSKLRKQLDIKRFLRTDSRRTFDLLPPKNSVPYEAKTKIIHLYLLKGL